jgi:hypothetical protein
MHFWVGAVDEHEKLCNQTRATLHMLISRSEHISETSVSSTTHYHSYVRSYYLNIRVSSHLLIIPFVRHTISNLHSSITCLRNTTVRLVQYCICRQHDDSTIPSHWTPDYSADLPAIVHSWLLLYKPERAKAHVCFRMVLQAGRCQ